MLNEKEEYWIKKIGSHVSEGGYNLTWGGDGGDTITDSFNKEKTKKKRSISMKKYWDNLSAIEKENKAKKLRGKKRSAESIKRYSAAKRGIKKTAEHLRNLSISLKKAKKTKELIIKNPLICMIFK